MSKEMLNRVSVPGKIFDLIWVDDEFYRDVSGNKKVSSSGKFPRCDQWCDERGFNIAFALAGYSSEDVNISVENNMLSISGVGVKVGAESGAESMASDHQEADDYPAKTPSNMVQQGMILRGIARRSFKVSYFIHPSFNLFEASASMKHGMLEINIPRVSTTKTISIDIKEN